MTTTRISDDIVTISATVGIRNEYRRLHFYAIAAYLSIALAAVTASALYLWSEHRQMRQAAAAQTATLARALEEHVVRTFTTLDIQLRTTGRKLVEMGVLERPSTPALVEFLRQEKPQIDFVRSMYAYDASGRGHTTSLGADISKVRARDFDHFREILESGADKLVVGRAIGGAVTRRPSIPIARGILGRNGDFAGIVGTAVEPAYFEQFYKALNLDSGAALALLRDDGAVLARFPEMPGATSDVSQSPVFRERVAKEPSGTVEARSVIDGTMRITSFHHVPGWKLIVTNSLQSDAVLAPWWRLARVVGLIVFVSLGIVLLLLLALRELRRRAQAEESLQTLNAELERRVRERTAKLESANKELETFTYSVSHDLKAPLRGIDGYSRLLLEEYSDKLDDEGRQFLRNVREGTQQMNRLLNDLLAYSRLERSDLKTEPVDLNDLVQSLLAGHAGEIQARGVAVNVAVPASPVSADREGLTMALRNLLENALKFTRDVAGPAIEIGGRDQGGACRLWVRDNGVGFDGKYQDKIFEIFQRLHRSEDYPGTGVGLAIVRKAIERMGGRAWAESEPGKGATFFLEIPK